MSARSLPSHLRIVTARLLVLVVDDDAVVLRSLGRQLKNRRPRWVVRTSMSAEEAIEAMVGYGFDAVVTDFEMPGMNGVDLLSWVAKRAPSTVRVILSGRPAPGTGVRSGAVQAWVQKNKEGEDLVATIEGLVSNRRARASHPT